jgi:large subunit ribosomal protein L9
MEIILKRTVDGLGSGGDVVTVANGYARNYLIPMQLAIQATEQNRRQFDHEKHTLVNLETKEKAQAEQIAASIAEATCTIQRRSGENDRLFGSVTSMDIAEVLSAQSIEIDRRHIELADPIRELGVFTVPIRLHTDVVADLRVVVEREE